MIKLRRGRVLLLGLGGCLVLSWCLAEQVARLPETSGAAAAVLEASTNAVRHITPGLIDGRVAYVAARMLEEAHYSKKPFDSNVSSNFLTLYLDTLDPQHIHFTQGDVAEFEHYRTNLDRLTVPPQQPVGDTRPSCEIFNRFFERLSQRTEYAEKLLKTEKFTFDTDERITLNRKGLPYPKDLDEAKQLWRERLRFEYLQERLGKIGARKKTEAAAAKKRPAATEVENPPANTQPGTSNVEKRRRATLVSPKGTEQTAQKKEDAPAQTATRWPVPASALAVTNPAPALPKKTEHEEIADTLTRRYHRNLRFFADWNNEDVLQTYLTALAHVYDPHSDYLGHAQLDSFAMTMNLSLFGIGAELTVSDDGYCTIRRLLPGGPAIKSKKIKENDRIVAVAQGDQTPVDVVDMSLNKAVQLIRGPKGTEVRLTMIPAGADSSVRSIVTIIRDEIPLEESAAKARIIELPDNGGNTVRLGVIDLPSFYATFDVSNSKDKPEPKSTTADVARLLNKLKQEKVAGVILDLRHNGGGSLEEAIKLTGLFIKTGPVVQVRQGDGKWESAEDTDASVLYEGPLMVLTSRGSASASEIVAGALQDYGRALIVGDASTHGKGTVQSVNHLGPHMHLRDRSITNDPGALKLTIKKFYRPSGASTQLKGVVPDIVLPSLANELKEVGEKALENPLRWDEIPSAKFDHFNLVEPYLVELRRRSVDRVATNMEFAYVREDVERYLKQQAEKTISLNEQLRLKENEETDARNKARDRERLARHDPLEKVYELTLKQADLPGLPPPMARTNTLLASVSGGWTLGIARAATNSAAASRSATPDEAGDDAEDEKPPTVDAPMVETEHILLDYLNMLPKGNLVTAGH